MPARPATGLTLVENLVRQQFYTCALQVRVFNTPHCKPLSAIRKFIAAEKLIRMGLVTERCACQMLPNLFQFGGRCVVSIRREPKKL